MTLGRMQLAYWERHRSTRIISECTVRPLEFVKASSWSEWALSGTQAPLQASAPRLADFGFNRADEGGDFLDDGGVI